MEAGPHTRGPSPVRPSGQAWYGHRAGARRRRPDARYAKLDIEADGAEMKYAVVLEKAANNWCAYVPDLPGCVSTGQTPQDTRRLIEEAIEFHIEGLRLHGEPVPEPSAIVDNVEVRAA